MPMPRRDVSGPSGPTGLSIGMLGLGITSLAVASLVCVFFYVQLRKGRNLRLRLAAEEKLARIGHPVLQRAPQHVMDSALDMSRLTRDMKEQYAKRQIRPSTNTTQTYQHTGAHGGIAAQSSRGFASGSGSSSSNSSGPIPASSSEDSSTSKTSSQATTVSSLSNPLQAPSSSMRKPVTAAIDTSSRPSFAREKRIPRSAVPSALLRGLGDLPQLPAPGSEAISSMNHRPKSGEGSYTPVLSLGLELNAKPVPSHSFKDDIEYEIERSRWLNSTLADAFESNSPRKQAFDIEAQRIQPSEKRMTGGPARVTVDYFSLTGRRNLAPAASTPSKERTVTSGHRSKPSTGSSGGDVSPYKKPDFDLPPIPTSSTKKIKNTTKPTTTQSSSVFRPLSLGLSLNSNSKSSSLNAATMFGDVPHTFWSEPADIALNPFPSRDGLVLGFNNSQETIVCSSSSNLSQLANRQYDSSTSLGYLAKEGYGGASVHSKEEEEVVEAEEEAKVERVTEKVGPVQAIPTIVHPFGTPQVPFMTPHHRAVFPDRLDNLDDDEDDSRQPTPDLSMIHEAPLPPTTLPSPMIQKSGFASSLRAKLTLNRGKSSAASSPTPSIRQPTPEPTHLVSRKEMTRPYSHTSSKSPSETLNSFGPPMETWKVSSTEDHNPSFLKTAPAPALGLGLSDEHGVAMDHQMSTSSFGQGESSLGHSPILAAESTWERRVISVAKKESIQSSHFVLAKRQSKEDRNRIMRRSDAYRTSYQEEVLGTPPMGRIPSPQFGALSTLSPKNGELPTMIGSDWTLNRQQQKYQQGHHAHQPSIASSYCDTISTCLTGGSENMGVYDGENAQDQRAKLLQTIQKNKSARRPYSLSRNSGIDLQQQEKGFFSHSARVSVNSSHSTIQLPSPTVPSPILGAGSTGQSLLFNNTKSNSPSSKKPSHLTIEVHKEAASSSPRLEAVLPLTAPLTPPWTPGEQTPKLGTAKLQLGEAASLQDKTPTLEQQKAARLAKLRPLSLAVQQQQNQQQHQLQLQSISSPAARFKASSLSHKSQSSSQSSSTNTSTTTPSASSSNTSLFQAHTSPHKFSSPNRANFASSMKRVSKSGVAPIGVLPTLSAEASPSFLTSTSTPRSFIGASSGTPAATAHLSFSSPGAWDLTPSPRFSRASVNNTGSIPYHSPLSVDAFSSPNMVRRR